MQKSWLEGRLRGQSESPPQPLWKKTIKCRIKWGQPLVMIASKHWKTCVMRRKHLRQSTFFEMSFLGSRIFQERSPAGQSFALWPGVLAHPSWLYKKWQLKVRVRCLGSYEVMGYTLFWRSDCHPPRYSHLLAREFWMKTTKLMVSSKNRGNVFEHRFLRMFS